MNKRILLSLLLSICSYGANAQKPYLTKVLEYCPAPGQFVQELPVYEEGDDTRRMAEKCLENIYDERPVSLGGYGGYLTVGFDHTILNVSGQKDILVYGNAFGGSSEPGIVMVSADTNQDGIPNDEWYELAGSEHTNQATLHGYEITYTRPAREDADVPWTDNQGRSGAIQYMGVVSDGGDTYYHQHPHYPKWVAENTLTFVGTCLPDNGSWDAAKGMWVMKSYAYGYADNHPNGNKDGCSFDIDWAVDKKGAKVILSGIDFVRIYTGVNQQIPTAGVGELSTEVSDVQDLHPTATGINLSSAGKTILYYRSGNLIVDHAPAGIMRLYDLQGVLLRQWMQEDAHSVIPVSLFDGVYIVKSLQGRCKLSVN